jgi:hypothetical protein
MGYVDTARRLIEEIGYRFDPFYHGALTRTHAARYEALEKRWKFVVPKNVLVELSRKPCDWKSRDGLRAEIDFKMHAVGNAEGLSIIAGKDLTVAAKKMAKQTVMAYRAFTVRCLFDRIGLMSETYLREYRPRDFECTLTHLREIWESAEACLFVARVVADASHSDVFGDSERKFARSTVDFLTWIQRLVPNASRTRYSVAAEASISPDIRALHANRAYSSISERIRSTRLATIEYRTYLSKLRRENVVP